MLFDAAWIRSVTDNVMVPVVRLFLQTQATLTSLVNSFQNTLLHKLTTIEDYGAIGDGVADDTGAFYAYVAALRAAAIAGTPHNVFRLGSGRTYLVSNSIDFTNFTDMTFDFRGSIIKITGVALTVPLIDMLGCTKCRLIDGFVYANDSTHPLLLGVLIGRITGTAAPDITFSNMHIEGYFTRAGLQNSAGDFVSSDRLTVINRATGATALGIIHDAVGNFTTPSSYVIGNTVSNAVGVTCNNLHFAKSTIQTYGGSAIWKSGSSRDHVEDNCNYTVPAGLSIFILCLITDTDSPSHNRAATIKALSLINVTTSAHAEFFFMTGTAPIYFLEDLVVTPATIQSTIEVFAIDTAYPSATVTMIDAELSLNHWTTLSAKVFDVPARYALTGAVEILQESSAVWDAPGSFKGQLKTDNHVPFNFNAASVVTCLDQSGSWVWIGSGWRDLTNVRIRLTANTSFYVTATGNDTTGNGTLATPWATPQAAHNWIYQNLDFNGYTVILNIGAGVFPGLALSGLCVGQVNPANYQITGAGNTTQLQGVGSSGGVGVAVFNRAMCALSNLEVSSSYSSSAGDFIEGSYGILATDEALITISGITFGACGVYQLHADYYGHISTPLAYTSLYVSGNAQAFAFAQIGGIIEIPNSIITFTTAVSYSLATAYATLYGSVRVETCSFVNPGNVTGVRYQVDAFGNIITNGGGPNFIPGTTAGIVSSSGIPAAYI